MIDILYYSDKIKNEIEGAIEYIEKAIYYKDKNNSWSNLYYKMGDMELGHAQNLFKIFEEDFKENKTEDPIYNALYKNIQKMYIEYTAKVKFIQESFNK